VIVILQKLMATIIGSLLVGIGVNGFLVPNYLIDGGILGIALILHYFFDFQTGITMVALSLPICIFASMNERGYFLSSLQGLLLSSLFIDLLSPSTPILCFPPHRCINRRSNYWDRSGVNAPI